MPVACGDAYKLRDKLMQVRLRVLGRAVLWEKLLQGNRQVCGRVVGSAALFVQHRLYSLSMQLSAQL